MMPVSSNHGNHGGGCSVQIDGDRFLGCFPCLENNAGEAKESPKAHRNKTCCNSHVQGLFRRILWHPRSNLFQLFVCCSKCSFFMLSLAVEHKFQDNFVCALSVAVGALKPGNLARFLDEKPGMETSRSGHHS